MRTFNNVHNLYIPSENDDEEENEERIIKYLEERVFLEVNKDTKNLLSIQDHYNYATYGILPKVLNKQESATTTFSKYS